MDRAAHLEQIVAQYVIDESRPFLDLDELREPANEHSNRLTKAADLLRVARTRDEPGAEPMCLEDIVGNRKRNFTLQELRAAHDLAQVRFLTGDMRRRAEATSNAVGGSVSRVRVWSVQWEPTGLYTAIADPDLICGWAAHPEAVADELCNWGTSPPSRPQVRWEGGMPPSQDRLCEFSPDYLLNLNNERIEQLFYARPERLVEVTTAVEALRNRWSAGAVPAQVAARASQLQQQEPQLSCIAQNFWHETTWTISTTAEWVPTRSIVSTPDGVWGEFDRSEDNRCSRWIPDRAAELRTATDLPWFLAPSFDAPYNLVKLHRLPGPAGPLYVLGNDGSHRTHLSRILGLPWLFATTLIPPPRKVEVSHVAFGQDECKETTRLWQGLLDSGVVHGQLIGSDLSTLQLDYVPAPWLLLPAELATSYNQRYELLHPGALGAVGVPDAALENADAWRNWLTGR
ncbi:MAG: hypothetical protein ACRDRW_21660 [Pseudonocardiaceae bacterium]